MDWTWWWWWWWPWWSWSGPRSARRAASCSWDRALRSPGREWPAPTSWKLGLRVSIISQSIFWSQVEREIYLKSRLADQPPCALSPSSPWSVFLLLTHSSNVCPSYLNYVLLQYENTKYTPFEKRLRLMLLAGLKIFQNSAKIWLWDNHKAPTVMYRGGFPRKQESNSSKEKTRQSQFFKRQGFHKGEGYNKLLVHLWSDQFDHQCSHHHRSNYIL